MERQSILVFHAGALGDFVLTWFLAGAARRLWPGCELTYVTHASKGRLAARFVGTAWNDIDVNGWHSLHGDLPALHVRARELLDRAGRAICFVGGEFADRLRELSPGMQIGCVSPIPPADWTRHVTEYYLEQLARELPRRELESVLDDLWRSGVQCARGASSRVVLHIGAGSVSKQWSIESMLELATMLRANGRETAMMAGEAELERMPDRVLDQIRGVYPLLCPRDYVELAEELLNTRLLVTADNGPGHLAGVLGCEVLSLFGPTKSSVWRPVGPRTKVVQARTMQEIVAKQIFDEILEF